jgi:hypothetical protein
MSDIKFKFSNDKQRKINRGGTIDPIEDNIRRMGRHFRHFRVNLTKAQVNKIRYPEGIDYATYALYDVHGYNIPPMDPRYNTTKPINMTLFCSENHPYVLARYSAWELDNFLTNTFGKYIVNENITEKDEPGIKDLLFTHSGLIEEGDVTENPHAVKHAFNVRPIALYEHDIDEMNRRLEIMGYKFKKENAIMMSSKTINSPKKFYFEGADF